MTDSSSVHDYESISDSILSISDSSNDNLEEVDTSPVLFGSCYRPTKSRLDSEAETRTEPVSQPRILCQSTSLTTAERVKIQEANLDAATSELACLLQKSFIQKAQSELSLPPLDWPEFNEYQAVQEQALPGAPPVPLAAPDYEEVVYESEPDSLSLANVGTATPSRSGSFRSATGDPGIPPELPFSRQASTFSTFRTLPELPKTNLRSNIRCFSYIDPHRCSVCQGPKLEDHIHLCGRCALEQEEQPRLATVFRSPRVLRANAAGVTISVEVEPKQDKKGKAWLCCMRSPDRSSASYKGYEDVYED